MQSFGMVLLGIHLSRIREVFRDRLYLVEIDGPGETKSSFVDPLGTPTLPHTSLGPGMTCTSSQRFKKDLSSD